MLTKTITWGGVICAVLLLQAPVGQAEVSQEPHQQQAPATPPASMPAKCKAMMAEREKMMADMKAADQALDALVAKMNAASGQTKVDATAAVVIELVAQRKTMHGRMMRMQGGMMTHMMAHMQAGKDSMAMCPMMKHMGAMQP